MSQDLVTRSLERAFGPRSVWELVAQYKIERHRPSDSEFQEVDITIERNTLLGYRVHAVDNHRKIFDDANPDRDLQAAMADLNWKIFDGPARNDVSA